MKRFTGVMHRGILMATILVGCGQAAVTAQDQQSVTVTVTPSTPQVLSLDTVAFAASVTSTADLRVSWRVVEASGGTIGSSGLYTAPVATGTYHVVATSMADPNATGQATVSVVAVASLPAISSFTASPSSISSGGSSTLAWSVSGATSLSIDQGVGTVTGTSVAVHPSATTTYTLTATNTAGSSTATAVVTVASGTAGSTFHVGPGQAYVNIGDVPWYALQAGDTVYIHYRANPYKEKFLISGQGTPSQWIRVLGVPGPNGELPVISGDGATTSTNMHYRWQSPTEIQWDGVIQVAVHADPAPLPAYIEIAYLQVQDGYNTYQFTAENGATHAYEDFAACIYAKSPQHLLVHDCVMTNCGQGFYNWTGSGATVSWYDGLAQDITIRDNYFYGNGSVGGDIQHQIYTEASGVIIEGNRFGPMRAGSGGSQIKDRSAGTVIRYNWIEQSAGWMLDLVEPENGWDGLGYSNNAYRQAFVYGNVLLNNGVSNDPNYVHWNEDHNGNHGRAIIAASGSLPVGKLFFYNNTFVTVANQSFMTGFYIFNNNSGGFNCPGGTPAGVIDSRNNIFAALPSTQGGTPSSLTFAYCGSENFNFGSNWVSPGSTVHGRTVTGQANIVSPAGNDPGFVDRVGLNFTLASGSSAVGIGTALAPEVTNNFLGLDLTPTLQLNGKQGRVARSSSGAGSDAGAFER